MAATFVSKTIAVASAAALVGAQLAAGAGSNTFVSQRNACPQTCSVTGTDSSDWTLYGHGRHLRACKEPMLLSFAIYNPVDDANTHLALRACAGDIEAQTSTCTKGSASDVTAQIGWSGRSTGSEAEVVNAVNHAVSYLSTKEDCSSTKATTAFSYINGSYVGIYLGGHAHYQVAEDLAQSFIDDIKENGMQGDLQLAQICGSSSNQSSAYTVGIVASSSLWPGDMNAFERAQDVVKSWMDAECISNFASSSTASVPAEFYSKNGALASSTTANPTATGPALAKRTTTPTPSSDGTCYTYYVETGDNCWSIGESYGLTEDDIDNFNNNTWGWMGCGDLLADMNICLSSGDPPMPASISNAECGPQVPGTTEPAGGTSDLAALNPCPLNSCCDIWGQCGITPEFCTATESSTGAPGTAANGTNGCISNCGTDIVKTSGGTFRTVGYFEEYNSERPCLNMDVRTLQAYTQYTHIHWAFANLTTDYTVDVSGASTDWLYFVAMDAPWKKIVSFGGWTFSTDPSTYMIFRDGVTAANRDTLAENIATFISDNDLDGVDFDWEYPGEPDIPGIPAGSDDDGANYLAFLQTVRDKVGDDISISVAAPASYWYLQGFPIANISEVVDYIGFMAYDLHGQWDYGNEWSDPGCPEGGCLRSHVNMTETLYALAMITKAGVPSNKIAVGLATYGRSFQMTDTSCYTPDCTFTGPDSGATPGNCTQTAGYISNAEINQIIALEDTTSYGDLLSQSEITIYGSNWVSYLTSALLTARTTTYEVLDMGGTLEWAVDLETFVTPFDPLDPESLDVDYTKVYCTDDVTNILYTGEERWDAAGCDSAWTAAVDYWYENKELAEKRGAEFSEMVAQFFNNTALSSSADCDSLKADNGCNNDHIDDCDQFNSPAGWLIMNSLLQVDSMYWNLYEAIDAAKPLVKAQVDNLGSTFDPAPSESDTAQFIEGLLEQLYSSAIAPKLSEFFSKNMNDNTSFDRINDILNWGISELTSGDTVSPDDALDDQLDSVVEAYLSAISQTVTANFDGSNASIANLYSMIEGGAFVALANSTNAFNMTQAIEAPIYAQLIPFVWAYSGSSSADQPMGSFVMDWGAACNEDDGCPSNIPGYPDSLLSEFVTTDLVKNSCYCLNGKMYYLCQLIGPASSECTSIDPGCGNYPFSEPSGISALNGSADTWGGLTVGQFVIGAVNTYEANGNKNGYVVNVSDPTAIVAFMTQNVTAPGGITIPVCNASEAWNNWNTNYNNKTANWPCD